MEEILASIRRIIADDDASKPAKASEAAVPPKQPPAATAPSRPAMPAQSSKPAAPPPAAPKPAATAPAAVANSQDEIDAMLAELDGPPKATPRPMTTQPAEQPAEVFDLTESMETAATPTPGPAPSFRTIDGTSDVVFSNRPEPQPAHDRALISNQTIAAVDSAFNTLAHTLIGQNARRLEDLVKEMLRPMLKSWLDDNLPSLVERIVRAEIERVSRGR